MLQGGLCEQRQGAALRRTQLLPAASTTLSHLRSLWHPQQPCWSRWIFLKELQPAEKPRQ